MELGGVLRFRFRGGRWFAAGEERLFARLGVVGLGVVGLRLAWEGGEDRTGERPEGLARTQGFAGEAF